MYTRILLNNLHLKDLNPRVCGRRNCPPGHQIGPIIRDHYIIHYVVQGAGSFRCGKKRYQVGAGEMFIVHPWEQCCYIADEADPWEYIWVGFECGGDFEGLLREDVLRIPSAMPIFTKLASCGATSAKEWAVCAQLYELFVKLAALQNSTAPRSEEYVSRAVNFITSNYSQAITVSEIAADLGLSRNYFCRIFKLHTGLSPQEYIVSYRLERAAEFMTRHELSQKEAARQAGYPDVYAFSRMFKRKYGMAPGAYTAAHKKEP